jgi:hypothetical protein
MPHSPGDDLIIVGTVVWAFFYILMHGVLEVKI